MTAIFRHFLPAFRRFSLVLLPVLRLLCCGHFFVAPPQQPTHFRCYFLPFSYRLPVLPPLIRHFQRFLLQFSPVFRRFSLVLLPVLRFLHVAAAIFLLPSSHPPIFAAISHHFPTGYRFFRHLSATSRGFCRNFPRFSAGFPWFFCQFSGFSTLLRPFSCYPAATHPFSLLFLTIFLPVTGSSATSSGFCCNLPPFFPGSPARSPLPCCRHRFFLCGGGNKGRFGPQAHP